MIVKTYEQLKRDEELSKLVKDLPDFIQFLTRKFIILLNADPSSKESTGSAGPGEEEPLRDHCIKYFEAFLQYAIELDGGVKICPRVWALAFQQKDLKSITRVLWRGVQNQDGDLDTKKEALRRPVIWMLDKKQDPWRFNLKGKRFATAKECQDMDQVYNTFDKTDNNPKYRYDCRCKLCRDDPLTLQELLESIPGKDEELTLPPKRSNVDPEVKTEIIVETMKDDLKDRLLSEFGLIDVFHWTMENRKIVFETNPEDIYPVDVLKFLTLRMLPNCKDIFVGPVQHAYKRWKECFKPKYSSNVLRWMCLFPKYGAIHFPKHEKFTYDEICPVIRLSISGGVAWITSHMQNDGIFGAIDTFDSKILGHNLMLSETDLRQIESCVNEKYGPVQNVSVSEVQLPSPSPSLRPYMHEGFSAEVIHLPEIDPLLDFTTDPTQNSAPQSFCNNIQLGVDHVATQPICLQGNVPFPIVISTTAPQVITAGIVDLTAMNSTNTVQPAQPSHYLHGPEEFTANANIFNNHPQASVQYQVHQVQNIPSCSTNADDSTSHPQYQAVLEELLLVEIEGYQFPRALLDMAERVYETDPKGATHAGEFFFENLFSNDEILAGNKKGRNGKEKFVDSIKYRALLEAVLRLKMKWNFKKANEGQSMSWSEVLEIPVDESTRYEVHLKTLEKAIFVDKANRLRAKLRSPKPKQAPKDQTKELLKRF